MNRWQKKYGWIILAAIFALIIVPGLVQLLMTKVFTTTNGGSNDGWLGFWGGYLGAIITVPTTVFVTIWSILKQIKESKNQFERQIEENKNQFERQIEENKNQFKEESRIDNLSKLLSIIISLRDDTIYFETYLKSNEKLEKTCANDKRAEWFFNERFLEFQKEFNTISILLSPNDINRKDFFPIKEALDDAEKVYVSQNEINPILQSLEKVVGSINRLLEVTKNKI